MLVSNWPGAQYKVISDAGHSALEPGIKRELVLATEMMKKLCQLNLDWERNRMATLLQKVINIYKGRYWF